MAKVVEMKHSDFNAKKLKKEFSKNSEKKVITKDVQDDWTMLKTEIDKSIIKNLRKSLYFLRSINKTKN